MRTPLALLALAALLAGARAAPAAPPNSAAAQAPLALPPDARGPAYDPDALDDVVPDFGADAGAADESADADAPAPPGARRKLRGRFLHITDMHPDPFYEAGVAVKHACHRAKRKPKKGAAKSGVYGTAFGECDSPLRLTNFTLDYLAKNWAAEIDFVVWTGDNARHDNDRKHPRTTKEIYALNRAVAKKMWDLFGSKGIPAIPSIGNNDVWPHNIMTAGPNSVTNEFSSIWKSFVPFPSYQVFQRGAYYSVEVIADSVAVIALNTMYFYDSNKAVGGCEYPDKEDPGNLQFDWLEVQLDGFRERNMQVYVTGHVPPSPGNYFPECYVRYAELALRFQDTILGHLFGHMNADHFFFLEADDLELPASPRAARRVGAASHDALYAALISDFEDLPRRAKIDAGDYAVVNVAPAVVPNPYTPGFRVFSYNITGAEGRVAGGGGSRGKEGGFGGERITPDDEASEADDGREEHVEATGKRKHGHHRGGKGDKQSGCKKGPWADTWRCHLNNKWHTDPESPSRTNKLWSLLGYAQYYIPELGAANKTRKPRFKLEYTTFEVSGLHPPRESEASAAEGDGFHYPIPLKLLPRSLRNATTNKSKFAPYQLADLTVGSWTKLAARLGRGEKAKLRKKFRRYMYLGGEEG